MAERGCAPPVRGGRRCPAQAVVAARFGYDRIGFLLLLLLLLGREEEEEVVVVESCCFSFATFYRMTCVELAKHSPWS